MATSDSSDDFDDSTMQMLSANLPSGAFNSGAPDPRLEKARKDAEETNQITPLLKEELRLRILSKRMQNGEPEIEINPGEPRHYELTEEEKMKREKRKAQNRRAAKKCREKRKMKTLSDAERYRMIREENQQLRNNVTYFRHRDEVLAKFCRDHILYDSCLLASQDEANRRRLMALLGPQCSQSDQHSLGPSGVLPDQYSLYSSGHIQGHSSLCSSETLVSTGMSAHDPATGSHPGHSQAEVAMTRSGSADLHYFHHDQTQPALGLSPPSTAAQAVLEAEQSVTNLRELKDIPIHEISSLCPTDVDFSVSDHSLECTPPGLSPTNLFSSILSTSPGISLSPTETTSPIFGHDFKPSTSYSNTNTSSIFTSNDETFSKTSPNLNSQTSYSNLGKDMCKPNLSENLPIVSLHGGVSKQEVAEASPTHDRDYNKHAGTHQSPYMFSGSTTTTTTTTAGQDTFPASDSSSVIINTAIVDGIHLDLEDYICFISEAYSLSVTGSSAGETSAETTPISPLTPLSPPSPNLTLSPHSPSALSAETNHNNCSIMTLPLSAADFLPGSTSVTPMQPAAARPLVRRASSTTSVPSPYFNHYLSSTLSPPPSVPSPSNHRVPESPSILSRFSTCEEMSYLPQFSPVSPGTSKGHNRTSPFDVSDEKFN